MFHWVRDDPTGNRGPARNRRIMTARHADVVPIPQGHHRAPGRRAGRRVEVGCIGQTGPSEVDRFRRAVGVETRLGSTTGKDATGRVLRQQGTQVARSTPVRIRHREFGFYALDAKRYRRVRATFPGRDRRHRGRMPRIGNDQETETVGPNAQSERGFLRGAGGGERSGTDAMNDCRKSICRGRELRVRSPRWKRK